MVYTWWTEGKPNPGMMANGMLAGLVAITAPSGFVGPIAGGRHRARSPVCWSACRSRSSIASTSTTRSARSPSTGSTACGASWPSGIFADGTANYGGFQVTGLLYGNVGQFVAQVVGAAVAFAWAFGVSYIFFKVLDRVRQDAGQSPEVELAGLDIPEMGLAGYIPDDVAVVPAGGTFDGVPAAAPAA